MNYNFLVFIYTYQCTSKCDICTFSCSPERQEKIDKNVAKEIISQAPENNIYLIGFAGGEPLLFKDEIMELAEYCSDLGLVSTITSNCFWGTSYEEALKVIGEMKKCGVNHLKISSDEFHSAYIPYDNIKNVLMAAKKLDLKVVIGCTSLKNSRRARGMLENIEDYSLGINIMEQTCYPLGRATEKFSPDQYLYDLSFKDVCRDQGFITIAPDGKAYPCGCMCGMVPSRELGSALSMNLSEIIEQAENNKHIQYIAANGINPYVKYIKENQIPIQLPQNTIDSCHMCYELFSRNENIPYLDKIINQIG